MTTRILYVARTDGTDARVRKEVATLIAHGNVLNVLIVDSNSNDPLQLKDNRVNILPVRLKARARSIRKFEAVLRIFVTSTTQLLAGRVDSVHLVDEEMIGIALVAKLSRKNIVLDLFDSIELKHSDRGAIIRGTTRVVSRLAKALADTVIVTDQLRLGLLDKRTKSKAVVVPNYPDLEIINYGQLGCEQRDRKDLFVGGTLYRSRGLDTVMRAMAKDPGINVECAGWLFDSSAESFVDHGRVRYHGILSQRDAYKLSNKCLVNIALYDPISANNIFASPNKVYDSLCMGQFVFINSEVKSSEWFNKSPLVRVFPYSSAEMLIAAYKDCLRSKLSRSGRHYARVFSWKRCEARLVQAHIFAAKSSR